MCTQHEIYKKNVFLDYLPFVTTQKMDLYALAIKIDKNRLGWLKKTQFRFDRKLFHATLITSNSFQKHLKPIAELMENKFGCQFYFSVGKKRYTYTHFTIRTKPNTFIHLFIHIYIYQGALSPI